MVHYTGYQVCDLAFLSRKLNAMIQQLAGSTLKIIFTKYSHRFSTNSICLFSRSY